MAVRRINERRVKNFLRSPEKDRKKFFSTVKHKMGVLKNYINKKSVLEEDPLYNVHKLSTCEMCRPSYSNWKKCVELVITTERYSKEQMKPHPSHFME